MPHTTRRETDEEHQVRRASPRLLSKLLGFAPKEADNRAARRRRDRPIAKAARRALKRERRIFRTVPVEGPSHAAARRARVRASRGRS